jgi:4-coumarate--CoA ligase
MKYIQQAPQYSGIMVHKSKFGDIDIPRCNILSYLFPSDKTPSARPVWRDARSPGKWLSPAGLLRWVQRFAVGLDRLGIATNEAIMVFTPNHIFVPVVYLGAAGSKRYYTGANPTYTVEELSFQMATVKPAVILVHPRLFNTGYAAVRKANLPSTKVFLFSDSDCPEQEGILDWKAFLAPEDDAVSWTWDDLGQDATTQIATINFSSGTTGLPKGVCISHYNLVSNSAQTMHVKLSKQSQEANQGNERWLAFLPLYHAFSQLFTINIACRLEVTVYIMQAFSFVEFLHLIQRHRITTLQAVPPVINMLAKRPETAQYDISSLRNIMVGAAAMSAQLSNELRDRFDLFIARGWGMTETTCVGMLLPDNVRDNEGSSGYLLPSTEAKIVDEEGYEVADTPGELWVRGPQTMLGYWNNEKATHETLTVDGWLKTGDIVVVKNDLWWVVDRKKEIIKVNGFQVAPAELEAVLLQHKDISDAAVVGLIVDGNEYPRAYVVTCLDLAPDGLTERDVQIYVAGSVAKHKHLTGGVQFVRSIPRLPSGKIMRSTIRQWAKQDAGPFQMVKSVL